MGGYKWALDVIQRIRVHPLTGNQLTEVMDEFLGMDFVLGYADTKDNIVMKINYHNMSQ